MDPTNCSADYRTDAFLLYGPQIVPGQCNVPVVAFATVSALLIVGRLVVIALVFSTWFQRQKHIKTKDADRRLPIIPMLFVLALIVKFHFLVLGGTNVVSSYNGTSGLIFMLWTFLSMIIALFYLNKIVKLGGKSLSTVPHPTPSYEILQLTTNAFISIQSKSSHYRKPQ